MRKISKESHMAFIYHNEYKKDNTKVFYDKYNNGITTMSLHNNIIAKYDTEGIIYITNSGYNTNTTNERLRSFGVDIKNSKGKLFLNGKEWDGEWIAI